MENILDLDLIIHEFTELKKIYDKNQKIIKKNERVDAEYNDISAKVTYLEENREYLLTLINDLNDISITDENYESYIEKFNQHKEKLEELGDELFISKVADINLILEKYPDDLIKASDLVGKVQFILNRIETDDWGFNRYLYNLREIKTSFTVDYGALTINKSSLVHSETCQKCLDKINELQRRLDEIDSAVREVRVLYSLIDRIKGLSSVDDVNTKIRELKDKYSEFTPKERFPRLKDDIDDVEAAALEITQNTAINAIKDIEVKVFGSTPISSAHLITYRKSVIDNYALLDSTHRAKVDYHRIIARIDSLLKREKRKGMHKTIELLYILVVLVLAGCLVGYYFYMQFLGIEPLKWLFNNPPYFGHSWQHWGIIPWQWVQSINIHDLLSWLLMVVVFVGSVICMLLFLIGECLWFLITVIAYGLLWVILTMASIVLHVIMYIFPAMCVFFAILSAVSIKNYNNVKSPLWLIVTVLIAVSLGVLSYLVRYGVIVFSIGG